MKVAFHNNDSFSAELSKRNPLVNLSGTYASIETPTSFQCLACSRCYTMPPKRLYQKPWFKQGYGCSQCYITSRSASRQRLADALAVKHLTSVCELPVAAKASERLEVQCANGHRWSVTVTNLLHTDNGCPECAGNRRWNDTDIKTQIQQIAPHIRMVGEYNGMNKLTLFECDKGHKWHFLPSNIIHNKTTDCPACQPYKHGTSFGKRTVVDGIVFRSRLEADCYTHLVSIRKKFSRQVRYPELKRMTCDFVVDDLWIEVSSIKKQTYLTKISSKREVVERMGQRFAFVNNLTSFRELLENEQRIN